MQTATVTKHKFLRKKHPAVVSWCVFAHFAFTDHVDICDFSCIEIAQP